ncbi:hypothetical protein [Kribbella sp. CA-247076]|uniref:hypothetical protein n=1 Tax=Kribbella sp. CA-247076 TaxID=3239941 RepID=UPI003D8EEC16
METRFSVRRAAAGSGFGVYDSAVDDWCTPAGLEQGAAVDLVDELNHRVAAGRRIDGVRWEAPRRVQAASWEPAGTIDVWIRDRGEWYARVLDETGRVRWHPGQDLRPIEVQGERMAG